MDRLNKVVNDFEHSLKRLEEAIKKLEKNRESEDYSFFRDSSIQRFEFTFEIMWKTVKTYLEREGVTCRSPRSCIREFFSVGLIREETAVMLMKALEDRNLTVHTYREEVAEEIASRLKDHFEAMKEVLSAVKAGLW
ncbi:MAG: HI0074 family nucleotidyltransferase substrate-binding subunit [Desulfurobacteriaceae bacterium]